MMLMNITRAIGIRDGGEASGLLPENVVVERAGSKTRGRGIQDQPQEVKAGSRLIEEVRGQ
jgi:hypothetical protein